MLQVRASNGCSQPQKPAPKWSAPTPNQSAPNRPRPKSHNHCAEVLVSLSPDVIVSAGSSLATREIQQRTRAVPIIFIAIGDPIITGVVKNVGHPEGNTTGVANFYVSIIGKWVELLKEAAPQVTRIALIYNPQLYNPPLGQDDGDHGYLAAIEEDARVLGMRPIKMPYHDAIDIVHGIEAFAAE